MSAKFDRIVKKISNSVKASQEKKTSAYDTTAKVLRVDGDIAWVHIPGGVDETPVRLTVNAKAGDEVQVRVGGGDAWLVGNGSAPPTDDRVANIANGKAVTADKKATTAKKSADEALDGVKKQREFFWHDDDGAHVLSDADGTTGTRYRTDVKGAGLEIFKVNQDGTEESVASFGEEARTGKEDGSHVKTSSSGTEFYDSEGKTAHILSAGTFHETVEGSVQSFYFATATTVPEGVVDGESGEITLYSDMPEGTEITVLASGTVLMTASRTLSETRTIYYGTDSIQELGTLVSGTNKVTYSLVYEAPTTLYVRAEYNKSFTIVAGGIAANWSYQRAVEAPAYSFQKDGKYGSEERGQFAFEHGIDNLVSGNLSFASGKENVVSGNMSFAFGEKNEVSGDYSGAIGRFNSVSGHSVLAIGIGLEGDHNGVVLGRYNEVVGNPPLLIGNGTAANRKNAFVVDNDGNVEASGGFTSPTLTQSYTSQYVANIYAEKWGKVVSITLNNMKSVPANSSVDLFTLPSGWRPSHVCMWLLRNPTDNYRLRVSINTAGVVSVYNYTTSALPTSSNAAQTCTFITA